jgi:hypothetical protein
MKLPTFADGEFVNAVLLGNAFTDVRSEFSAVGNSLFTPGLSGQSALTSSISLLTLTLNLPAPFRIMFATGKLVGAHGVVNGVDNPSATLNVASLVPGSGSITVIVLASASTVGLDPVQVIGPPVGHPDYDPTFAPFTLYSSLTDTLILTAGTTAADNLTTFEICRFPLAAGATVITGLSFANQLRTGAVLSQNGEVISADLAPTGVAPGTYVGATLSVGADGRLTNASGVPYGPLAGNNIWTGTNTFNFPTTFTDTTGVGGVIVNGITGQGANIRLNGGGSSAPTKWLRAINGEFSIVNNAYNAEIFTLTDLGDLSDIRYLTANGPITGLSVQSSNGNVTAINGRLRASYGARGSGDANAATLLADFSRASAGNAGYIEWPDGTILQWTWWALDCTVGAITQTNVPHYTAFPNNAVLAVVQYGGYLPPGITTNPGISTDVSNPYYTPCFVGPSDVTAASHYGILLWVIGW